MVSVLRTVKNTERLAQIGLVLIRHGFGEIVSRLTADIALAQNFVGAAMTNIWMDVVACVFYLGLLLSMDVQLTVVSLLVFPLYILCMRAFGAESKRTSKQVQAAMEEFSGDLQERVAGYALVKSFTSERRDITAYSAKAETPT